MPGQGGSKRQECGDVATRALEHTSTPVLVVDGSGRAVMVNPAARELVGMTVEAPLPADPVWVLFSDASGLRTAVEAALSGERAVTCDLSMDANDARRAFRFRWDPLPPDSRDDARAVGVASDVVAEVAERERADHAVAIGEQRIRALLRVLPDLMFRMDGEGRFLELYAEHDEMLYVSANEVVGHTLAELLPEPVASESLACVKRALATGTLQCHEYSLPVAPGHRYFEARHIAIEASNEVLAIVRDVTDRRFAEEALRHSERQYRMLMDRASDAIVITDEAGHLLSVNRQACRLLGRAEDELRALSIPDFVPDDQREAALDYVASLRDGEPHRVERRLRHRDGHFVDVEVSIKLLPDGRVQGILRDITERKRAEEALKSSEESFRQLIERSPNVIVVHRDGVVQWVNEACAKTFGVPPSEMIGRPVLDLVHPEDRAMVADRIRIQERTGEPVPAVEERFVHADGSIRYGEVVALPLAFRGMPSHIVIAHDITERKQAEAERRRLEAKILHAQKLESLGVLAGGIAHDFNNLLMGVLGNASLALVDLETGSAARECVQRIEIAAHRAADLTKQLLAYSGRGRFVVEPLNLSTVVQEMVHLLQTVISKKATLRLDFADNLPAIHADATQIRQVIMNLITNASDALGDGGGHIVLRTGVMQVDAGYLAGMYFEEDLEPGVLVFVEVSDTGCGMDADTRDKIFDPFFTTKFTGRGLGLAAVVGIVRGHRGAIKLYSEPGRGTCFKILFPRASASSPSKVPPADRIEAWQGSGGILVVDDEETVRSVARLVLERHGFAVMMATDGKEAVDAYRLQPDTIDLVILDMTMPRMGGEEAFRELRKINPDLRILLSSGYNEQETVHRFTGRSHAGFIQKPYTPTDLIERVRSILEGS